MSASEAKGLLEIITNYTQSFVLLNQFASNNLPDNKLNETVTYEIEYSEPLKATVTKETTDQKERGIGAIR